MVLHVSIRGEACFSVGGGGSSFLSGVGGSPWGGIGFDGWVVSKKVVGWGRGCPPTIGNPESLY